MADFQQFLKITHTNTKSEKTYNRLDLVLLHSNLNYMPGVAHWKNRPLEQGNVEAMCQYTTGEHYTAGLAFFQKKSEARFLTIKLLRKRGLFQEVQKRTCCSNGTKNS